jgi:hypothetical protein
VHTEVFRGVRVQTLVFIRVFLRSDYSRLLLAHSWISPTKSGTLCNCVCCFLQTFSIRLRLMKLQFLETSLHTARGGSKKTVGCRNLTQVKTVKNNTGFYTSFFTVGSLQITPRSLVHSWISPTKSGTLCNCVFVCLFLFHFHQISQVLYLVIIVCCFLQTFSITITITIRLRLMKLQFLETSTHSRRWE